MGIVAIIGEGLLADGVSENLEGRCAVIRQAGFEPGIPREADLALALRDDWRPDDVEAAERHLREAGLPWIGAYVSFDEGIVGPYSKPGKPGCSRCADARRLAGGHDFRGNLEPLMSLLLHGFVPRDPGTSDRGIAQMAPIVAKEALSVLEGNPAFTDNGIYRIDLRTLESSLHKFLPNPLCPCCGGVPDDSPEAARIELRPSLRIDADSDRRLALTRSFGEALIGRYVDKRVGLFREMIADGDAPFAAVGAVQPTAAGAELSAGRGHSYERCGSMAILEGLERYCGMTPRGKRTAVTGSYRQLADRALDPRTTGLYDPERYADPDFEFEPFDDELVLNWVWGYSFARQSPILVPEQLVYYDSGGGGRFAAEGSSGCALGGSLEEAILYGLLEAAERDSFLMTWYARLPLPRLDPESARDAELSHMVNLLRETCGYDTLLFNATLEYGVPSLLAVLKNTKRTGANLICATSAGLDPVRAARSAVLEAAGRIRFLGDRLEQDREEAVRMLDDSERVVRMEDHALLYGLPEAEGRLSFLLRESPAPCEFAEQFAPVRRQADLTGDLKSLLAAFLKHGLDVIAIDQTAPELADDGLRAVKTLVPGLLPMTFGHRFRRLNGLKLLRTIPAALGYAERPLTADRINPYPHPFY
ncbi:SagD family biosynthesis docking scaffold protein [Cohnella xylanilytica]|uniref:TOMM precursor leader peptide-binding protein n=1 Tax=Cohnella xylanilytica TaxID=557555 RepID=UPI001B126FB2|nr:TOMM precursor leader peptide-binding protein [Cohnella xylanilytica]GIO16372.1 SagD family biosynthesis docking scaffold protein [Cohnella xylanilytica]